MGRKMKLNETDNIHGDHIASCLCCVHADFYEGSQGYSEMTPGSPASCECSLGFWDFDSINADLLKVMHDSGRRCASFYPRD